MTTTADKIKFVLDQLRAKSKNDTEYADSILKFFDLGQEHRFSIFAYVFKNRDLPGYIKEHMQKDLKPPDPEPLECWARVDEDRNIVTAGNNNPAPGSPYIIPMREVTPQDEQDRKDAARYRYLKGDPASGSAPLYLSPVGEWDERIDKAMEDN